MQIGPGKRRHFCIPSHEWSPFMLVLRSWWCIPLFVMVLLRTTMMLWVVLHILHIGHGLVESERKPAHNRRACIGYHTVAIAVVAVNGADSTETRHERYGAAIGESSHSWRILRFIFAMLQYAVSTVSRCRLLIPGLSTAGRGLVVVVRWWAMGMFAVLELLGEQSTPIDELVERGNLWRKVSGLVVLSEGGGGGRLVATASGGSRVRPGLHVERDV